MVLGLPPRWSCRHRQPGTSPIAFRSDGDNRRRPPHGSSAARSAAAASRPASQNDRFFVVQAFSAGVDFFAVVTFFAVEGFFAGCFAAAGFFADRVAIAVFFFEDSFGVDDLAGALVGCALAIAAGREGGAASCAGCVGFAGASGSAAVGTGSGAELCVGGSSATLLGASAGARGAGGAGEGGAGAGATGTAASFDASVVATGVAGLEVATPAAPMAASAPPFHFRHRRARNIGCIVGISGASSHSIVGGGASPTNARTNRLLSFDLAARGTAFGFSADITNSRGERSG